VLRPNLKVFFYEVEELKRREYERTLFRNSVLQVHAQKRVQRIERTLKLWNIGQRLKRTL